MTITPAGIYPEPTDKLKNAFMANVEFYDATPDNTTLSTDEKITLFVMLTKYFKDKQKKESN